jgi:Ca-activated chloride channel family protein
MKKQVRGLVALLAALMAAMIMLVSGCGTGRQQLASPEPYREEEKMMKESLAADMAYPSSARAKKDGSFALSLRDDIAVNFNTEEYDHIAENEFKGVKDNPLSTFSIDVDTASYANVRRYITASQLPPRDAVRIEEMINYFDYDYPQPGGEHPFSVTTEISECPWNGDNRLVHIGLQGKSLDYKNLKPCNLVLLVDSSGSMSDSNKLPLLKQSLKMLLKELSAKDRIAIVAYAGSAGLVLPSTPASRAEVIVNALDSLNAGGSTAGGEGIVLAYRVAKQNLIREGNNRVILCTDGDFNVGTSSTGDLVRLIEEKRKDDIYLTICGFGMGNYKDGRMEQISNAGNGNYFYIDSIREAQKVFVKQMRANMFAIAKDVKIQIEFNPAAVKSYRLVGYENRILAKEDFNDDRKDAGELGAGHTVTALYEIVPSGVKGDVPSVDPLKYQTTSIKPEAASNDEIMTLKLRYKPIKEDASRLISVAVKDSKIKLEKTSDNFRFSAAVAGYGMILRDSKFKNALTLKDVIRIARGSLGKDSEGYRKDFLSMAETTVLLMNQ